MISIIIPTLNEETVLEKTLLSLKKLTNYDYEIIISDGKSTDKTIEIAKKYNCKIVEYKDPARQTIGQGRNLGAKVASGEYFIFIDADVVIPDINNFFTKAMDLFKKRKNLVGLTVMLKVFPEMATLSDKLFFAMANFNHRLFNNILHTGSASGEFQMIRADIFKQINGYNEKLPVGEDNEIFSRLNRLGQTYADQSLYILHTSRRAHKIGWPKLILSWILNAIYVQFLKRSYHSEWKPIR